MPHWKSCLAALALSGFATAALAQTPAQPRDPNMPDPKTVPAEKIRPQEPGSTGSTGPSLSDKLQASEGVIRPPETATPDMTVRPPVPNPNSTPVITPPGTSPFDPVQPK
jgi:hypothetical protein